MLLCSRGSNRGRWTFLALDVIKDISQEEYSTMPIKDPEERRLKQRQYSSKHYHNNREAHIERIRVQKIRMRAEWEEYKSTLECVQCGQNHPATLDFHHVIKDPANRKVSELTQNGAYKLARAEIESKCVVLCASCHRIWHHEERQMKEGSFLER